MKKIKDIVSYYTVESYAVFKNVDSSILKLNKYLKKYGYQFIRFGIKELEEKFSDLFLIPENFQSNTRMILEDDVEVSYEFYKIYQDSIAIRPLYPQKDEVFFLKRTKDYKQKVVNNTVTTNEATKTGGELQKFVTSLVQQLRLFKYGDAVCSIEFQISTQRKKIVMKSGQSTIGVTFGHVPYVLTDAEALEFSKNFKKDFSDNMLTKLAIINFNTSYSINDVKIKYITLMTCLESLFNQGKDQITHIVARHLSLIISNNETEFDTNYSRIKKLYDYRSSIVHGGTPKENIGIATAELQDKVRLAINYCLNLNLTKEELFKRLNRAGFERL